MDPAREFLQAVLESAEVGVVVIDSAMRPLYINASARQLLDSPDGQVPDWLASALPPLQAQLARSAQAVDRVSNGDLTLRVRLRALEPGLTGPDAALLALLWRGLSNEEIAQALQVRTGTIKSRLFRLYQKLGVKKRPAAVLRAAEVLGHQPVAAAA
jgi:DNA-binding NarL/FixJ family response regulator